MSDPSDRPGAPSSSPTPTEHLTEKPSPIFDVSSTDGELGNRNSYLVTVPLSFKLASIVLVSAIGFGSAWSSGITGVMKTAIKKVFHISFTRLSYYAKEIQGMNINNTQYAILDASEDFMATALVLLTGQVTDRIGGAGKPCSQYSIAALN
jgi:hypothetical protein